MHQPNAAEEWDKENIYSSLRSITDCRKRDLKIIMGDLNTKVGKDKTEKEFIMGRHGIETSTENRELFTDLCSFSDFAIGGTIFTYNKIHKTN